MKPGETDSDAASPEELASAGRGAPMEMGILNETFGYLLRRAWRDVDRRFTHHFRTIGLTAPQFSIMILIRENSGCTPGDLVAPMGIGQNNLVGIVGDLIKRGYVTKTTDQSDRRARILTLTPEGSKVLDEAHEVHDLYQAEYVERMGADRLRELVRILRMFDRG
jgi:DNA-binding MarR family transcriptional regulator